MNNNEQLRASAQYKALFDDFELMHAAIGVLYKAGYEELSLQLATASHAFKLSVGDELLVLLEQQRSAQ